MPVPDATPDNIEARHAARSSRSGRVLKVSTWAAPQCQARWEQRLVYLLAPFRAFARRECAQHGNAVAHAGRYVGYRNGEAMALAILGAISGHQARHGLRHHVHPPIDRHVC